MDKVFKEGKFGGDQGSYSVGIKGGDVVAEVKYASDVADGEGLIKIKSEAGLDVLAAMIPGQVDDVLIGLVKGALKL